jgi:dTDP-4-dehydrorhamnose reductase
MKKILILGIKGMAGHVLFDKLSTLGQYDVYGVARNIDSTDRIFNLDVYNTDELKKIIDFGFDVIINCIGILNKEAEDNPYKAIWYNSYFPHLLEFLTKRTKTKVITISTDCVFSGKNGDYSDYDIKDGVGFYSTSKSLGEILNEKDLTIRTSIIGPELNKHGIGLFNWFMHQKNEIYGYSNVFWSGITTIELVYVIHNAITINTSGLLVVATKLKISKYDLIHLFVDYFRKDNIKVIENGEYKIDKSMKSLRTDFEYEIQTIDNMLLEMKHYIQSRLANYPHYSNIS